MKPLRIAMTSYYLPSGSKIGVGYWVHELATALTARGHAVTLFSACPPVADATYETRVVALRGRLRTFRFALALRQLDFSGFDVLHTHGDDYWLWRDRGLPHIRTMHGSCFSEALRIKGLWERLRMFALGVGETLTTLVADETVCVSPETRRWMPWVRTVVPCGVDLNRFSPGERREALPTLLFVGTYQRRKRGRLLMEAFAEQVRPHVPNAQLWMVCEDAPDAPGVTLLGRVSDAELIDRYRRAWGFCLPSSYEGLGIPYIEAIACGTPVVATANPGSRFVLGEGEFGAIASTSELGRTLVRLLTDEPWRRTLESAALVRRNAFGLEASVVWYEQAYARLGERRSNPNATAA